VIRSMSMVTQPPLDVCRMARRSGSPRRGAQPTAHSASPRASPRHDAEKVLVPDTSDHPPTRESPRGLGPCVNGHRAGALGWTRCTHPPFLQVMQLRFALGVLLAAPLTLSAQQRPPIDRPSPSNGVARTFLSYGQPYGGWILMALDSIPASQYGFRPTAPQQRIGHIAQHLESANYALCSRFGAVQRAASARDSLADTIKARWPKDTLIARVRASLVFCGRALQPAGQLHAHARAGASVGPAAALTLRRAALLPAG
jgi:hypothetical protein